MRRKIAMCLSVVTLLALSVPAVGMAGPVGDVNHEIDCITKMAENECPDCMTLQEKIRCIQMCVKHKLEGKQTCETH